MNFIKLTFTGDAGKIIIPVPLLIQIHTPQDGDAPAKGETSIGNSVVLFLVNQTQMVQAHVVETVDEIFEMLK